MTTCITGATATFTALILGLPVAGFLSSLPLPGHRLIVLFFLPLIVPPYLNAECWIEFFFQTRLVHVCGNLLTSIGISPQGQSILHTGLLLGFSYFPILLYTSYSGLISLSRGYKETASMVLSPSRVVLRIILPMIRPHIVTGCLLVFILSITNYAIPSLLGVKTFPVKIYTSFSMYQNSFKAFVLSIPFLAFSLGLIGLLDHFLTRGCFFSFSPGRGNATNSISRWFLTIPIVVGGICLVPFVSLFFRVHSLSLFLNTLMQAKEALVTSLEMSLACSLLLTLCGLFMGYEAQRSSLIRSGILRSLFLFSFALPGVLHAIGLIRIWNTPWLAWGYQSCCIIFLLWAVRYLPVVQRFFMDQVAQIPPGMEETAKISGLNGLVIWKKILFPLLLPKFLLIWALIFVLTMTDLGGLLLVVPPGFETLPMRLYNLMHYGSSEIVAATAIILACACILPVLVLSLASSATGKNIQE